MWNLLPELQLSQQDVPRDLLRDHHLIVVVEAAAAAMMAMMMHQTRHTRGALAWMCDHPALQGGA